MLRINKCRYPNKAVGPGKIPKIEPYSYWEHQSTFYYKDSLSKIQVQPFPSQINLFPIIFDFIWNSKYFLYFFQFYAALKQHKIWKHSTTKSWKCDEQGCEYAHTSEKGLKEHKRLVHPKESDLKFCPFCPYKAPTEPILKRHTDQVHLKIKNFQCEQCARRFFFKAHLETHIKGQYCFWLTHPRL